MMQGKKIDFVLLLRLRIPIMLAGGIALYFLVLGKTWDRYTEYRSLKNTEGLEAAGVSGAYTSRREREVDALYRRMEVDTLKWQNALWEYVSELSKTHHARVGSFPPVQRIVAGEKPLLVQSVAFKGEYTDLIPILAGAARRRGIGLVHSLRMVKKARDKDIVLTIDMAGKAKD